MAGELNKSPDDSWSVEIEGGGDERLQPQISGGEMQRREEVDEEQGRN